MTTHRRYRFEMAGVPEKNHAVQVSHELRAACEIYWWFTDPEIQGEPFGRLIWFITVAGRDQWWTHRRAMKLADQVCWRIGDVPTPTWETLPPHTNRGRYRSTVL